MLNNQDLAKLENLKGELKKAESNDIQEDCAVEFSEKEVIQPKEDKPKKTTTRSKKTQLTEEKIQEMLDDHFAKIKDLLKATENNICYRVWNGLRVELKRQYNMSPEYKKQSEGE